MWASTLERLVESTFAGGATLVAESARTADDGDSFSASASASAETAPSVGDDSDIAAEQRPLWRAVEGLTDGDVFAAPEGTGAMR